MQLVSSTIKVLAIGLMFANMAFANNAIDETWGSSSSLDSESFTSGLDLKATKKVGIGVTAAGATGLFGLNMHINLSSEFAIALGYGLSRGFNAFNVSAKQAMGGAQFIPYFIGGYSRWFSKNTDEAVGHTAPGFLKSKFLNAKERRTGQYAENIVYPGLGLEFVNKQGDWQGVSFFTEILYLVDVDDFVAAPTAGIGSIIYF